MSCLGVFFALTAGDAERLLAASSDKQRKHIVVEEIETQWDEEWLLQTDKAWDALDRCLSDSTEDPEGARIRQKCVLGGRELYGRDDYIICFLTAAETKEVAGAIRPLDEAWMRRHYFRIDPIDYEFETTEEDFEYTWECFQEVQAFFQKAAAAGRPMIFTADQ